MAEAPIVVIDASVGIARLRTDEHTPELLRAFRDWSSIGARLIVPRHFWWEVVNGLAIGNGYSGERVLEAIHELELLGIQSIDPDRGQLLLAIGAVERFRLTAYDAQYLVLAETLVAPLATLDRNLARAAGIRARYLGRGDTHRLSEQDAVYEHDVTWPSYRHASAYLAKLRAEARDPAGQRPTTPALRRAGNG
jgi:predicted nucleic acid-binding protein